eukprot:8626287-Karenia_brevis.AAC.1
MSGITLVTRSIPLEVHISFMTSFVNMSKVFLVKEPAASVLSDFSPFLPRGPQKNLLQKRIAIAMLKNCLQEVGRKSALAACL